MVYIARCCQWLDRITWIYFFLRCFAEGWDQQCRELLRVRGGTVKSECNHYKEKYKSTGLRPSG
jgi:hypothetical protein